MPLQATSPLSNGIHQMDETPDLETTSNSTLVDSACSQCNVARSIWRPRNQRRRTFRYLGCITWTVTEGWVGNDDDDVNDMTHNRRCITFQLPFTSTQLSMHYYGGIGTPSYALNVTHIIEEYSELSFRIWKIMRPGGDPEELHDLVSRRKLSLYSMYRYHDQEFNLFFVRIMQRATWFALRGC